MEIAEMLKALEAEAREQANNILADAQAQANQILKEAEKSGKKLADESFGRAKQRLTQAKVKVIGSAYFDQRKEILKARKKVIDELFAKIAKQAKQDLNSNQESFRLLAKEALEKISNQKVKVMVNSAGKNWAEKIFTEFGIDHQVISGNSLGGLKLVSEDGRITVDNTLDCRLQRLRQTYNTQIVKSLFGDA